MAEDAGSGGDGSLIARSWARRKIPAHRFERAEAMSDADPPHEAAGGGLSSLEDLVRIGRGGFATVYRAFQPRFGRRVAVKVLDAQSDPLAFPALRARVRSHGHALVTPQHRDGLRRRSDR